MSPTPREHEPSRRQAQPDHFRGRPRGETRRYDSSTLGMALTFGLSIVASPEGLAVRTSPPAHPRRQAG